MTAKQIIYAADSRERMGQGVEALAAVVGVTMGPRGRNVLLDRPFGPPLVTKDGATVAEEIELLDKFANLGAQLVKEVADKTSSISGDGTTTATVLAGAIYSEGVRLVAAGADPMELKRGIDAAVRVVVAELQAQSKPVSGHAEISQVATVSAHGDESVGELIADAMEKVGRDGVVTVEVDDSTETTLDYVSGMQVDRGYLSPYFVTDHARMEAVFSDALVLVLERKVSNMRELVPLLEEVSKAGRSLVILADDFEGEALATLVLNRINGVLGCCAVKGPGYGDHRKEILRDIAVLCGTQSISSELGIDLSKLTTDDLGRAKMITVDKDTTTIVEGAGMPAAVAARGNQVRMLLADTTSDHDRERLQARLARLVGGVAVVRVGATTESAMKEKKARVEDALHATRAALKEGIVPGGGVALLRTLPALATLKIDGDQQFGVKIVRHAIEQPLKQIAQNAGQEGAVVVRKVLGGTGPFGYNASKDRYEDLLMAGIVDPTMVVRVALQNAASVAALMLTTEVLIAKSSGQLPLPGS